MLIILESPTGKRKWKIEPLDSGLCFKISKTPIGIVDTDGVWRSKKNGRTVKKDWIDLPCYPTTLESAIEKVVNLMIADPEDEVVYQFSGMDITEGMLKIFKRWLKKTLAVVANEEG